MLLELDSWQYLLKHTFILITGFLLFLSIHKIPFYYFKGISILLLPIVILMLIYTISQGNMIDGVMQVGGLKFR